MPDLPKPPPSRHVLAKCHGRRRRNLTPRKIARPRPRTTAKEHPRHDARGHSRAVTDATTPPVKPVNLSASPNSPPNSSQSTASTFSDVGGTSRFALPRAAGTRPTWPRSGPAMEQHGGAPPALAKSRPTWSRTRPVRPRSGPAWPQSERRRRQQLPPPLPSVAVLRRTPRPPTPPPRAAVDLPGRRRWTELGEPLGAPPLSATAPRRAAPRAGKGGPAAAGTARALPGGPRRRRRRRREEREWRRGGLGFRPVVARGGRPERSVSTPMPLETEVRFGT
jgi:hypothetical protein